MERSVFPNTFLVGAPKCGTTALASYLGGHPDVFVATKELHYFGSDLRFRHDTRLTGSDYQWYFRSAGPYRVRCDASVWYLASTQAAAEISREVADARIIIMIRNPADMMHSLHNQALLTCQEEVEDFEKALELEPERAAGRQIPADTRLVETILYRNAARYSEQIRRFMEVFPAERLHVIVYDDLVRSPVDVYRSVISFLGLEDDGKTDFPVVNSSRQLRNRRVGQLLRSPPDWVRRSGRVLVPSRRMRLALDARISTPLARANEVSAARRPLSPPLESRLLDELDAETRQLEEWLDRPLSWSQH